MKKIATLLILSLVITATTFAADIHNNINDNVLTSFNSRFAQATEVSWSKANVYLKATFKINGQVLSAFYAQEGQLMGISRNLLTTQLPINLQTSLAKSLETNWVTELFEFATDDETAYYITVENADQQVSLKSTGNGTWSVYKKVKKN